MQSQIFIASLGRAGFIDNITTEGGMLQGGGSQKALPLWSRHVEQNENRGKPLPWLQGSSPASPTMLTSTSRRTKSKA